MKDRILKTGAALALILTLVASVLPLGALAEGEPCTSPATRWRTPPVKGPAALPRVPW